MLHRSLDAFAQRDSDIAFATLKSDDEVDALYNDTYRNVMAFTATNGEFFQLAQRLEWAAHNLERAADRATNICEWVIYLSTGEFKQGKELIRAYEA